MKDHCPNCGHKFGLTGAPFALPPGQRKPAYYCPACGSQLRRIDSTVERVAAYLGYGALLGVCAVALWNLIGETGDTDRPWMKILYVSAIAGIGIHLVYGFVRQHYVADTGDGETAADMEPGESRDPAD